MSVLVYTSVAMLFLHRIALKVSASVLICLSCAFYNAAASAQDSEFSKLVVFGDSLSDTGNIALINLPFPYYQNRISNGPVGVDIVATSIGSTAAASRHLFGSNEGFNYSVSGGNVVGSDREDLNQQVSAFLNRVDQQADGDALYLIVMGGNDLRDIRSITDANVASQRIQAVVAQMEAQIERLINAGARSFLVTNVPNVGRIPETLQREADDPGIAARVQSYVIEYNAALSQALIPFTQRSDISFVAFDFFQVLEDILNNFQDLGFTTGTEGCFSPDGFPLNFDTPPIELECLILGFDSRVFFDNIHPSAATNAILGPQLVSALPSLPDDNATPQTPPGANSSAVLIPTINLLLDTD